MRKVFNILLFIVILISLILPNLILASEPIVIRPPIVVKDFAELVARIIDILVRIAIILAPLLIIIGALYFLIPDEKAQNIETGKKIILYTIIGFIIILLADGIVGFLRDVFEKK